MSDEEKPPERPTARIETVPPWAIELTLAMKTGIASVRADISLVSNDLGVLKQRVSIIEGLRASDEERVSKMSGGVRSLGNANLEQDTQLAKEVAAREALATKVDVLTTAIVDIVLPILKRLDDMTKNPTVKIAVAIATAVAGFYAASRGLK